MRQSLNKWLLLPAAALLLPAVLADDSGTTQIEGKKSALASVRLGEHMYGPKLGLEDLKGRVVLVDFWGIN